MTRFKLAKREKMLLGLLLVVAAGALVYRFWLGGEVNKFFSTRQTLAAQQAQLAQAEKMAADLPLYETQNQAAHRKLQALVVNFPNKLETGKVLLRLEGCARQNGVRLQVYQPLASVDKQEYLELPVRVVVTGTYSQIVGFLRTMESLPNLMGIRTFSIQPEVPKQEGAARAQSKTSLGVKPTEAQPLTADITVLFYGTGTKK